ncbi:ATP-binding protein [Flavitalea sp. BT771]|uniref:ATP-binding protein n=1 Tax=Flavitalea sp. BT771 TaxID=3063329 RepID=UPI0026E3EAF0|nr:ATP-binding protein [Flavitalea sp. BT771]MDO6433458.1 ATP-binding protein [Flavitalea sp. BT771]MDV6222637.1 ATP-binding protein [Flavitalea sp. BT771]
MKRHATSFLTTWKASATRKPLIIRGARQVGKTWVMKEFGRSQYEQCAYVNFESNAALKTLFTTDFNIRRILTAIQIEAGVTVEPGNTLIILDEIQEAPGALTSLKYFQENAPEYHVISAGSLLGVALNNHTSFPVGKVDFLDMYPLDFTEFLEAMNETALVDLVKKHDWELIKTFKSRYIELLKQYYYVGGMPEPVSVFIKRKDFKEVRQIQQRILNAYEQDFSKHAPNAIVPRIRMLWNAIPSQLAKENRKFIYGLIKEGARAKEYELAMSWLIDCGLIHKVNNVSKPAIPLKAYEDFGAFKLFLVDVGLLAAMAELDAGSLLEGNAMFEEFKGALTEQYVLQQLVALKEGSIHYWSPGNARSEIDFLVQIAGNVIPIEVKAAENLKAKSLQVYHQKYNPVTAIRTSMADFRKEEWMINLPLYAIREIFRLAVLK